MAVEFNATGFFAWCASNGSGRFKARVKKLSRKANKMALSDWATRRGYPSLQFRGSKEAWATLRLTPRSSERYKRWQRKVFGSEMPYRSPRGKAKGEAQHMMDQLRMEGSGYTITSKNNADEATSILRLPGARILNIIQKPFGETYRREFLNKAGAGRGDLLWVGKRASQIFMELLKNDFTKSTTRTRVKGHAA